MPRSLGLSYTLPERSWDSLRSLLLVDRVNIPNNRHMTGNEFIRKVRRLGRKNGVQVTFVPRRGKGTHGTLFYGSRFTVVRNPRDELKTGTLHAMLDQLDLSLDEL